MNRLTAKLSDMVRTCPSLAFLAIVAASLTFPHATRADDAKAEGTKPLKVFMFTKSSAYEHSVVHRKSPEELSMAEQFVTDLGKQHGFEVTCSKDGQLLTAENLKNYDVVYFFTQGELDKAGKDGQPPVPEDAKAAILDFVKNGGGFMGTHCGGADTYHNWTVDGQKPFLKMVGAEFIGHGPQQVARVEVVDPEFPAMKGWPASFELNDEWYAYKDFQPNIHVLMLLQTEGMKDERRKLYDRPPYPICWCSNDGKGRVFYTGLGHREDVWQNPKYQEMVATGILWAGGRVAGNADPNLSTLFGSTESGLLRINPPK